MADLTLDSELLIPVEQLEYLTDDELAEYLRLLEVSSTAEGEWSLQARQQIAEDRCDELMAQGQMFELLYGGAGGGGKSEWLLYHLHRMALRFPGFSGLLIRRTYTDLYRTAILRSLARYDRRYCHWEATRKRWRFDNGSIVEFGYCDTDTDVFQYDSAEYDCVTAETEIVMGDGSLRRIDKIRLGDLVQTLEGPRAVERVGPVGVRPTVRVETPGGSVVCSLRHRLLAADGSWVSPLGLLPTSLRIRPSMPEASRANSRVVRRRAASIRPGFSRAVRRRRQVRVSAADRGLGAASAGGGTGAEASCGPPRESVLPQAWSARLALVSLPRRSAGSRGSGCPDVPADVLLDRSVRGSRRGYPTRSRSDGGRSRGTRAGDQGDTPSRADAGARSPDDSPPGGLARTRTRTPAGYRYSHPYTMEPRVAPGPVRPVSARISPAGDRELWDMRVRGENHYVSSPGIVHANCVAWDELTQFPTDYPYRYLFSRVRTSIGKTLRGLTPHVIAGTNPHRTGVAWVKPRWVDLGSWESVHLVDTEMEDGSVRQMGRVFIPAKIDDNRYINKAAYLQGLALLDEATRKAMEEGSWDVIEGQYFNEWDRELHVVPAFTPPLWWRRIGGLDFGIAAPFCHLWVAFDGDGAAHVYKEAYKAGLSPGQQVDRIRSMEPAGEKIDYRVADPSIWARSGAGPPIASQYLNFGMPFRRANNARIDGWARLRDYLRPTRPIEDPATGLITLHPRLYVMDECRDLIRTLPLLVHDRKKPEDVDTEGEDHAPDALRYALMSVPLRSRVPESVNPQELLNAARRRANRREEHGIVEHPVLGALEV